MKPVWALLPAAANAARRLSTPSRCDPTPTCGRWRKRQQILNNNHSITSTVPRAPSYIHFFCSTKFCDSQTVMIRTLTGSRRCTWAKQLTSGHTGRQWWTVGLNKEICLLILCSKICIGRKHAGSRCPIFTHNLFLVFITNQIWKFIPRRKKSCNVICTK